MKLLPSTSTWLHKTAFQPCWTHLRHIRITDVILQPTLSLTALRIERLEHSVHQQYPDWIWLHFHLKWFTVLSKRDVCHCTVTGQRHCFINIVGHERKRFKTPNDIYVYLQCGSSVSPNSSFSQVCFFYCHFWYRRTSSGDFSRNIASPWSARRRTVERNIDPVVYWVSCISLTFLLAGFCSWSLKWISHSTFSTRFTEWSQLVTAPFRLLVRLGSGHNDSSTRILIG